MFDISFASHTEKEDPSMLSRENLSILSGPELTTLSKSRGSNHYKIPHMSKEKLERQGMLPISYYHFGETK